MCVCIWFFRTFAVHHSRVYVRTLNECFFDDSVRFFFLARCFQFRCPFLLHVLLMHFTFVSNEIEEKRKSKEKKTHEFFVSVDFVTWEFFDPVQSESHRVTSSKCQTIAQRCNFRWRPTKMNSRWSKLNEWLWTDDDDMTTSNGQFRLHFLSFFV